MTDRLDRIEAILDSVAKSQAEFDREMKESREAWEKEREESNAAWDKQMKESREAWEKEREESNAAWDKQMKESREAWEKEMKEEKQARRELAQQLGGYINSASKILEDQTYRSLKEVMEIDGIKYHFINRHLGGKTGEIEDEYDVVLSNESHVFLVEVKRQPRLGDFQQLLRHKKTFPLICPPYADFQIHLGLAGEIFHQELLQKARGLSAPSRSRTNQYHCSLIS